MDTKLQKKCGALAAVMGFVFYSQLAAAGEELFGFVKGAETLPDGALELYQVVTVRSDKGQGTYQGINYETELEYGATDRFSVSGSFKMMALDTSGLVIDGYLPKEKEFGLRPSGVEAAMKYMFLSPAKDDIGLAGYVSLDYDWIDPHSGQDKDTYSLETEAVAQKFMMEGQMVWSANLGIETTYADRAPIDDLPEDFDWPTDPEMEIEFKLGTGISYRFAPNWFAGIEAFYETEFETEVGQERWSVFAGPSLHYGSQSWWGTITWLPQIEGGGEQYEGQRDTGLHLIEKTEEELRLKLGFNF